MADKVPIRAAYSGANALTGLATFASSETIGVAHGGTGIATAAANQLLTGNGTSALTSESNLTFDGTILKSTGDLCATVKVVSPALCIGSEYVLPTADGSAGQIMCTDGSGALAFATASAGVTLAGSTNNTIATVTGSDALAGEANLTFDGSTLGVAGAVTITKNNDYGVSTYDGTNAGGTIGLGNLSADANGGWLLKNVYYNGSAWAVNNSSVGAGAMKFDASGNIIWLTQASGSGLPAERMRIDSAGKVGIGTASPAGLLHASQTTAGIWAGRFDNNQTDGPTLYANHTGGTSTTNSVLRVDAAGTNAFEVKSNGYIGVNTYTPDHQFEVEAAGNTLNTYMGSFKTTVGTYNLQVEGTHGGVTGTVLNNYQNSSSPADGDFAGMWNVDYKDDGGNRVQIGSFGWFVTDVSAGTRDSYFYLRVYNNNSAVAGTLSSSGVWTDSSAAAQKEYYGTRQEVWPDGILGSLKTLNVSKYKPANHPKTRLSLKPMSRQQPRIFGTLFRSDKTQGEKC
jgi:hypothetical protein